MTYKKERVKEEVELEDVYNILEFFNAEPQLYSDYIVSRTVCHDGDSNKLYYYSNTQLFKCYSGDCGTFDIFELVQKIKDIDLNAAVYFVVHFLNLQSKIDEEYDAPLFEDFALAREYAKIQSLKSSRKDIITLPEIDDLIRYYPQPRFLNWEREDINYDIIKYMGIKYDPVRGTMLIPHRDQDGRLVGIRQRTLVQEDEIYGKYRPARLQGQLCNHPLGFNLYGLDIAKDNIKASGQALIVEGEKSVLKFISYFGLKNNISVAVCGNSLSAYQFQLLQDCGAREIVVGFDKDYEEKNTVESAAVVDKLMKLQAKFKCKGMNFSFLFDVNNNTLGYKDSPLDQGKEAFMKLWRNKVVV